MFNKLALKPFRLWWVLIVFVLAACGQTPPPTPPPPTSTPLPEPTAEESGGEVRTFVIAPEESQASYIVEEEFFQGALTKYGIDVGLADTIGTTQNIEGQLQIDLTDLSAPLGTNRFTVNLSTLTSDQSQRDNWIRENGPEFNQYPLAEFVATGVSDTPDAYTEGEEVSFQMMGDLTIREVTQPAAFDVTATLDGNTATGVATTQLRMSDFGIEPPNFANTLTVGDEFTVRVEFTAREQ